MLEIMRAVPLTTRAKRSAISCRCELNVSIQINKGSSYRMVAYGVLHNPGAVCELCLHQLALRAVWPALCLNASSIWLSPLPVLARSLFLFLSTSLRSLLRCCGVCFLLIKSDSTTLSLPSLSGRQPALTTLPPARCASFDVLHFFFAPGCFHFTTQLNSSWSRLELRRGAVAAQSRL